MLINTINQNKVKTISHSKGILYWVESICQIITVQIKIEFRGGITITDNREQGGRRGSTRRVVDMTIDQTGSISNPIAVFKEIRDLIDIKENGYQFKEMTVNPREEK